jgi:hypothetical protein
MRGILFYLDGVFYTGDKAVPSGAESLEWVRPNPPQAKP